MTRFIAIVPAYNEEAAIAATVGELATHAPEFDIVVIDDGSTDRTYEVALEAGARVLQLPFNLGIGGAVQAGYQYALSHGYEIAVQVDGDGQHDPRCLATLVNRLYADPSLNMVTGSRFLADDEHGYRSSATRRVGIRIFGAILSMVVGRRVTDPTSGLRVVDRKGIELFARDYPHDYPEVEAVLLLHQHSLAGTEVPVRMRERQTGVSSINAQQSVYYMIKVTLAVLIGLMRARPAVRAADTAAVQAKHAI